MLINCRVLMPRVTGKVNREVFPMTGTAYGSSCLAYHYVCSLR